MARVAVAVTVTVTIGARVRVEARVGVRVRLKHNRCLLHRRHLRVKGKSQARTNLSVASREALGT